MYELCTPPLKLQFLDELRDSYGLVGDNWIVGGDFNLTRFSYEKSNRATYFPLMANVNNFITDSSLINFSPSKFSFTLSNFQEETIMVKLDCFLVSPSWESHFPRSNCTGKARLISDHVPICLDTKPLRWGSFSFKFYRSWLLSDGF